MTILLAGGYGKTSLEVAKILTAQKIPFVVGSRRGQAGVPSNVKGVKFDWEDSSTFPIPFDEEPSIDRVYMTIATTAIEDLLPTVVVPFVDLAKKRGVKRFVFLSASLVDKGAWIHGKVHQYLADSGLDYAILRPTWFYENFTADYRGDIRDGRITTATKQGKLPFISTKDIAEVAVSALTDEKSHNTDHIIFGPELLSYDDVCARFTKILGHKVTHGQVSYDDLKEMYSSLPPLFSSWMVDLDRGIAEGREEKLFHADIPGKVIGKVYLDDFIKENKEVWLKK